MIRKILCWLGLHEFVADSPFGGYISCKHCNYTKIQF